MLVVLSFESGERREVELAGVPRRGDYIRLSDVLSEESSLEVEHVLWLEETAITKKAVSITGPNSHHATDGAETTASTSWW
jgi:hypothetical protein